MKTLFGKKLLPFALVCALFCTVGVTACKKPNGGETGGEQNGNTDDGSDPSDPSAVTHEHGYSYTYDADGHWQICAECGDKTETAAHTIADGACTVCGYRTLSSGLAFEINEDRASYTLSGIGTCEDLVVGVPQEYEGKPVTNVKAAAFANNATITAITFPSTLTEIGSMAFFHCTALQTATLPESLNDLGGQAFGECALLKRVRIGKGLAEIPAQAFYGCTDLTTVVFSEGSCLQAVGVSAFEGCASLTEIELPSTVGYFAENAFAQCASLRAFTFGEETNYVGAGCFEGCASLSSVTLANKDEWRVYNDITFVEPTEVSATALASATAAELFTQTYVAQYWKRGEVSAPPSEEPPVEDPPVEDPPIEDPPVEDPPRPGEEGDEQSRLEEQERLEEERKRLEEEKKRLEEELKRLEEELKQLEEEQKRLEEEEQNRREEGDSEAQNGGND